DAVAGQRLRLEGLDVVHAGLVRRQAVPGLVEQGGGQVLGRGIALVEGARGQQLLQQRFRQRLAGLVVARIVGKDGRVRRQLLVDLRRELDEVARHVGARQRRGARGREEAVQGVAELVEGGDDVVEGQQRRLVFGGVGEVADVERKSGV